MKTLNTFIHRRQTSDQRLATVRGIVEGTAPTGRQLFSIPVKTFRAKAAPKWVQASSGLSALRDLNLNLKSQRKEVA